MNNKGKIVIIAVAAALVIAGATIAYNKLSADYQPAPAKEPASNSSADSTGSSAPEEESVSAPDFMVYDADGNTVQFSDFAGKPMVLNFWASWCPPCKAELPDFEEMYLEHGDEVVFMMVNMTDGRRETQEKASSHIESMSFTFPVYFDLDYEAATVYGIRSLPTTVFVDSDGNITKGYAGQISGSTLADGIADILPE